MDIAAMVKGKLTMNKPKLKPCPFCGARAIMVRPFGFDKITTYHVECALGCCKTFPTATAESAVAKWNRRKNDE